MPQQDSVEPVAIGDLVSTERSDEAPATVAETRSALLERSKRDFAPIRKIFVQAPAGSESRHGPLADFVRGRDLRGLQALLFLLGLISSSDEERGWSSTLPIQVWARAFGTTVNANQESASTAVSKVLARLEKRGLVQRTRVGRSRNVRVTLLREDGSGDPYTRPGKGNADRFLKLPHAYWTDGWWERLDLPATAMLLVALHEPDGFVLPTDRVPEWYGWSADTAERGFAKLVEKGALAKAGHWVKAPLSPSGKTWTNRYYLRLPFMAPRPPVAPAASPMAFPDGTTTAS